MMNVIILCVIMLRVTNKYIMLSVVMLSVIMLSVTNKPIMLCVVMLSVAAPYRDDVDSLVISFIKLLFFVSGK
jgi:hypothetical protein